MGPGASLDGCGKFMSLRFGPLTVQRMESCCTYYAVTACSVLSVAAVMISCEA